MPYLAEANHGGPLKSTFSGADTRGVEPSQTEDASSADLAEALCEVGVLRERVEWLAHRNDVLASENATLIKRMRRQDIAAGVLIGVILVAVWVVTWRLSASPDVHVRW